MPMKPDCCAIFLWIVIGSFNVNVAASSAKPFLRVAATQIREHSGSIDEGREGHLRGRRSVLTLGSNASDPFPLPFFSEDANRMAAMPAYDNVAHARRAGLIPEPKGKGSLCDPQCSWKCGPHIECNQVCEPACAPPVCHTLCSRHSANCETRCGEPRCAVVCPHRDEDSECVEGKCKGCKTICAPPLCTTQCGDDCQSVCEQPVCMWKCKEPEVCPKPKCALNCKGFDGCGVLLPPPHSIKLDERLDPNTKIFSEALASNDPMSVYAPAAAPPAWSMTTTAEPTPGARQVKVRAPKEEGPTPPPGPVAQLTRKFAEEDAQARRDEKRKEGQRG